jgi:hypothetical protein
VAIRSKVGFFAPLGEAVGFTKDNQISGLVAHLAIEAYRRLGVKIVSSPTCSLFALPRRCTA